MLLLPHTEALLSAANLLADGQKPLVWSGCLSWTWSICKVGVADKLLEEHAYAFIPSTSTSLLDKICKTALI